MKKEQKAKVSDAYRKAMEELRRDKVMELKSMILKAMERRGALEAQRKAAEEELKSIDKDMADLKAGRFQKIKDHHEKNKLYKPAVDVDKIQKDILPAFNTMTSGEFNTITSGGSTATWHNLLNTTTNNLLTTTT